MKVWTVEVKDKNYRANHENFTGLARTIEEAQRKAVQLAKKEYGFSKPYIVGASLTTHIHF